SSVIVASAISLSLAARPKEIAWDDPIGAGPQLTSDAPGTHAEHWLGSRVQSLPQINFPDGKPRAAQLSPPKSVPSHSSVAVAPWHCGRLPRAQVLMPPFPQNVPQTGGVAGGQGTIRLPAVPNSPPTPMTPPPPPRPAAPNAPP